MMAGTVYFEEEIRDFGGESEMSLEIGTSSYYGGTRRLYMKVDDKLVIIDDKVAKGILEAMSEIGRYLGLDET